MEKNKIEAIPERLNEIFFGIPCSECPLRTKNVACARNLGILNPKYCTDLLFDYVQGKELPKAWEEDDEI